MTTPNTPENLRMRLDSKAIPPHILAMMPKSDRKPLGKAGLTRPEIDAKTESKNEIELQKQIYNLLVQYGVNWIGYQNPRKKSQLPPGTPDFVFCYKRISIAIEVKTKTGKLSDDQKKMIPLMEKDGWLVHVVRSLAEVKSILDKFR